MFHQEVVFVMWEWGLLWVWIRLAANESPPIDPVSRWLLLLPRDCHLLETKIIIIFLIVVTVYKYTF